MERREGSLLVVSAYDEEWRNSVGMAAATSLLYGGIYLAKGLTEEEGWLTDPTADIIGGVVFLSIGVIAVAILASSTGAEARAPTPGLPRTVRGAEAPRLRALDERLQLSLR